MMRLIDADNLKKDIREHYCFPFSWGRNLAEGAVNAQPTVEAMPVVRCKDCRHFCEEYETLVGFGWCMLYNLVGKNKNGFCDEGERI